MRGQHLCLLAWAIAVGVITDGLTVTIGQSGTNNTRPAQILATENSWLEFRFSPSNTNDTSCQWIFSTRSSPRLHLILIPQLRSDNGSCVDNLTAYDGNSTDSPILLSTCTKHGLPIYSSGSDVLVSFTAGNDDTDTNSSFHIYYKSFWPESTSCSSYVVLNATNLPQDMNYTSDPVSFDYTDICWMIRRDENAWIVSVNFTDVHMDSCGQQNCSCDTIEVKSARTTGLKMLGEVCGDNRHHVFNSSQQVLYLSLRPSSSYTRRHFHFTYRSFYREDTKSNVSVSPRDQYHLSYPGNKLQYSNNTDRGWLFEVTNSQYVLRLTFTDLDIEWATSGCYDYIDIFDSASETNQLDRLCGIKAGTQYYSTGHTLYTKFHSDDSISRTGFNLTCEAVLREVVYPPSWCVSRYRLVASNLNKQFLQYPAITNQYSNFSSADCDWLIVASNRTHVVRVTFISVDIEASQNGCVNDYVEVFDSTTSKTNSLGRLCGQQTQREFISSGQGLKIEFKNDGKGIGKGFHLTYEAVLPSEAKQPSAVCKSSIIMAASPVEKQLRYPANYPTYLNNAQSCWLFQTNDSHYVVKITFLYIDVEPSSSACNGDYIEVFNSSSQVNKLDRLCGIQKQKEYSSTGQFMYLTFHSDNEQTAAGFRLTYQAVPSPSVLNWTECNGLNLRLMADSHRPKYLTYPGNQTNYPNNADCSWLLQTSSYHQDYLIHVTFSYVDIQANSDCFFDYVEVFDDSSLESNKLASFCGHQEGRDLYSSGQSLLVRFHSDGSSTGRGFALMYEAVSRSEVHQGTVTGLNCSRVLPQLVTHSTQYAKYPANLPTYSNNLDCGWLLHTSDLGYVVHVTFMFVDIESSEGSDMCNFDYVGVYDGVDNSAVNLGRLCGSTVRDFYSSGQYLYIHFHSDSSITGRGFQFSYREVIPTGNTGPAHVLPQVVTTSPQYFTYPLNAHNYINNADCAWRLLAADYGYVVHVIFTQVDIEQCSSCTCDYVQVYDGSDDSAVSLGRLCGSVTREFYSSRQNMYIKFHSDSSNTGTGFHLSYQEVAASRRIDTTVSGDDACLLPSAYLTALMYTEQSLSYPSISSNYPDNVDCGWLISADNYDYVVHVIFTFVDTEWSSSCIYGYIEVFDGTSDYSNSLGRLCGSTVGDFYSSGQSVYIRFHSDSRTTGRGFRLTYQAVPRSSGVARPLVATGAAVGSISFFIVVMVIIVAVRRRRSQQTTQNSSAPITTITQNAPYSNLRNDCTTTTTTHAHLAVRYDPPPYNVVCQSGTGYPGASGYVISGQQQYPPMPMATAQAFVTPSASQVKGSHINQSFRM